MSIETNRPDFDRLVNTWLPYQLYASRLFGRVGPNQRGGAFGYRDQLQDVLPLILIEPHLTRAQIVLHAGQQFLEGDVLKWWHRAPGGGTGLGQRTKASDPHLWLPYVLARYVAQTGDRQRARRGRCPISKDPPCPNTTIRWWSRRGRRCETDNVYEHARRAIEYTLRHMGANGLPLLGAGDWNDGIDALGGAGVGTSVWMGFFFFDVLPDSFRSRACEGDEAFAQRCGDAREALARRARNRLAGRSLRRSISPMTGSAIDMPNAMTTGWAAHSGAVDFERAVAALEGGLKGIERPDRILLLETPFFEHSRPYPGRIADYPPGVRENGGQYSHGASWIVDGFLRVAREARERGDAEAARRLTARAFEIFEKISPLQQDRTRDDRGLRPHPDPATRRHL